MAQRFTLLSPSMTIKGTEVAGQRCLAGRGLSQFQRTITCMEKTGDMNHPHLHVSERRTCFDSSDC